MKKFTIIRTQNLKCWIYLVFKSALFIHSYLKMRLKFYNCPLIAFKIPKLRKYI